MRRRPKPPPLLNLISATSSAGGSSYRSGTSVVAGGLREPMPSQNVPCIVCESPATQNVGSGDVVRYDCPRCGAFVLSGTAEAALPSMLAEVPLRRSLMSHTLRRSQQPGNSRLGTITTDDLPSFWSQGHLPTPGQQTDSLIVWAGDHQQTPSDFVEIHRPALAATIGLHITGHDDAHGFAWLNSQLEPKKLYELVPRGNNVLAFKLTLEGWERYEQLKKTTVESRTAPMANVQRGSPADHGNGAASARANLESRPMQGQDMIAEAVQWDVFVCHASEDKDDFVRPLARGLETHGLKVWFDEFTLTVGDSLRRSIDRGLAGSRFGVVVISPDFLLKEWPQRELDGLVARETGGVKVILPVWHNITADLVRKYSPTLADRLAVSSAGGLEHVIAELLRAIEQRSSLMPDATLLRRASMQPAHFESGTTFEKLSIGHFFRFYHRNEAVFGFKAVFNHGTRDSVALVLTPNKAGLQPGDLLSTNEVEDVIRLAGVKVIPSTKQGAIMTPGAGNFAEHGEIELHGDNLIFVASRRGSPFRVNLQSGEIGRSTGVRPKSIRNGRWYVQKGIVLKRFTSTSVDEDRCDAGGARLGHGRSPPGSTKTARRRTATSRRVRQG
jgi:TIR domain